MKMKLDFVYHINFNKLDMNSRPVLPKVTIISAIVSGSKNGIASVYF